MKIRRRKKRTIWNWKLISVLSVVVIAIVLAFIIPSLHKPPLQMTDLEYIMPDDHPSDYDIYRVVAVKPTATKNQIVGLMNYFTRAYLDENRVLIYVFNNRSGAYVGESQYLVARYFQDKSKTQYIRDIYMDEPPSSPTSK